MIWVDQASNMVEMHSELKLLRENMLMSNDTHETARTQFVQVGDVRFAYRRFGQP